MRFSSFISISFYLLIATTTSLSSSCSAFLTTPPTTTTTRLPLSFAGGIPRARQRKTVQTIESASWSLHPPQEQTSLFPYLSLSSWTRRIRATHQAITAVIAPSKLVTSLVLALNAGLVNGACLSGAVGGTSQSVAAVTASWTHTALIAASGKETRQLLWLVAVIGSYMGGSAVAGYWNGGANDINDNNNNDNDNIHKSLRPLTAAAALLCMASALFATGHCTGHLLCAAAVGLQNSLTSSLTHNLCRTTHLSGMTSDMGTLLGQWLRQSPAQRALPLQFYILLALTSSFWMGGLLAAKFVHAWKSASLVLLVPAVVYTCVLGVHELLYNINNENNKALSLQEQYKHWWRNNMTKPRCRLAFVASIVSSLSS